MAGWEEELNRILDKVSETHKPPVTLADPKSPISGSIESASPAEESTCLLWLKFPASIYGADLKVALESTFPKGVTPKPTPGLIVPMSIPVMEHDVSVARFYHPAYELSAEQGRRFIFVPRFTKEGELFRRLVFRRKMSTEDPQRGRMEMMLGRMGEENPFGFSCWKQGEKGDPGFVPLAFPGKTPTFTPVYVRIESTMPVFLKIEAEEVENGVMVSSTSISPSEAPGPLQ